MEVSAILFDMDGVMIDTHRCAYSVLSDSAMKLGVDISADEIIEMGSLSGKQFWTYIKSEYELEESVEELVANYDFEKEMSYYEKIGLMPNLVKVLSELKVNGYKLGLVTSAKPIRTNRVLSMVGRADIFDVVITSDDVTDHKPSPSCYLTALDKLCLKAENVLVVEDSSNGALAAKDSGCKVIGFQGSMWNHDEFEADFYISNHIEIIESVLVT